MNAAAVAEIVGSVWKVLVAEGEVVEAGQQVAILESMKMEIPVVAPVAGRVTALAAQPGQIVQEGDPVVHLDPQLP